MEVEYDLYVNGQFIDCFDADLFAYLPKTGDYIRLDNGCGAYIDNIDISDKELVVTKIIHAPYKRTCEIYTKCRV